MRKTYTKSYFNLKKPIFSVLRNHRLLLLLNAASTLIPTIHIFKNPQNIKEPEL
ncbi:hypothetical protein [Peribacillus sp. N1]